MPDSGIRTRRIGLISAGIATAALLLYLRSTSFPFIVYDDPGYVYENPMVLGGLSWQGVAWAFTTGERSNWHPLTWLSHMADVEMFALSAGGHHLTNVMLHAANAALVFAFLFYATGSAGPSLFAAMVFALHPTHVESVAWVSERKDVLCAFFFLLALFSYVRYTRRRTALRYGLATALFILALLAKPMAVTWPCLLLLLDLWPLNRRHDAQARSGLLNLVLEKLPWFALSAAHSAVTLYVQSAGKTVRSLDALPLDARLQNAVVAYARYVGKTVVPTNLAPFYPHEDWNWQTILLSAAVVFGLSAIAVCTMRRYPYVFVGWFWFLGMLVPVIGLVQVGGQSMADRYLYLPQIGITILIGWAVRDLVRHWPALRRPVTAVAMVLLVALSMLTWRQLGYWRDSVALFTRTLAAAGKSGEAHTLLGYAYQARGEWKSAAEHYSAALDIQPGQHVARNNLSVAFLALEQWDDAEREARTLITADPGYAPAYLNLGAALEGKGLLSEAATHYASAIRVDPNAAQAYEKYGAVSLLLNRSDEAILAYTTAVRLAPTTVSNWTNLGIAFSSAGRHEEAAEAYTSALRLDPANDHARYYLALSWWLRGNAPEALRELNDLLKRYPDYTDGIALRDEIERANSASRSQAK